MYTTAMKAFAFVSALASVASAASDYDFGGLGTMQPKEHDAAFLNRVKREMYKAPAINVRSYEHYDGLSKRSTSSSNSSASTDTSLRTSESWYWGSASNPNANLTGRAKDTSERILSMERFSDVLKGVYCSGNNIEFQFISETTFSEVQKEWAWINQAGANSVILVTEVDACVAVSNSSVAGTGVHPPGTGTTGTRQPHNVTSATFNTEKLSATFVGTTLTWSEALDQYFTLRVASKGILSPIPEGKHGPVQVAHSSNDTSSTNNEQTSGNGTTSNLQKRITVNQDFSIPLAHDFSTNIFNKQVDDITASLDCSPCGTSGSLDFDINVVPFIIPPHIEGSASLTPSGVGASFALTLTVSGDLTDAISESFPIVNFPLPGSFSIPGVIDLGPSLVVDAGVSITSVNAAASLTFGVDVTIPDDSVASVDFSDSSQNKFTDWVPQFAPIGPEVSASVSVSGNVAPQISLQLDIQALNNGLAAGLVLSAPQLDADLSAQADSSGVCGGSDVVGIQFDMGLGAEFDAFGGFGSPTDFPNKVAILSTSTQLFSTCIGIGGGTVAGSATAAPASSAPAVSVIGLSTISATAQGSAQPSAQASNQPAGSAQASGQASVQPSQQASAQPSQQASAQPSIETLTPSVAPSAQASQQASQQASAQPAQSSQAAQASTAAAPSGSGSAKFKRREMLRNLIKN